MKDVGNLSDIGNYTSCPLCLSDVDHIYHEAKEKSYGQMQFRKYYQCSHCSLVFLAPELRLNSSDEKKRYLEHNNNPDDPRYLDFLMQSWMALEPFLKKEVKGLDMGCGPNPVLANYIVQQGYEMDHYDPYFYPNDITGKTYDFITCTEVIEHVYDLYTFFKKLKKLLVSGGHLALMTDLLHEGVDFKKWYYRQDNTHICFFQKKTLNYIEGNMNMKLIKEKNNRVIIFKKL